MRVELSHLVGMEDAVTAVITMFESPCLVELEKEESCVCCPCVTGEHKEDKRGVGEPYCSLRPPGFEDALLLNAALSFEGRAGPPGGSQRGLQHCLALLSPFTPPLPGGC